LIILYILLFNRCVVINHTNIYLDLNFFRNNILHVLISKKISAKFRPNFTKFGNFGGNRNFCNNEIKIRSDDPLHAGRLACLCPHLLLPTARSGRCQARAQPGKARPAASHTSTLGHRRLRSSPLDGPSAMARWSFTREEVTRRRRRRGRSRCAKEFLHVYLRTMEVVLPIAERRRRDMDTLGEEFFSLFF
jgi:hypothetical protein